MNPRAETRNRMAQRVVGAFNRFVDQKVVPQVQPIVSKNVVPDRLIRMGIRAMLRDLLASFDARGVEGTMATKQAFVAELKTLPIAVDTRAANEQHYEVPTEFYQLVLGPCLKYSCGLWSSPSTTLAESETAMLELYCERAELVDGMKVLDLGCGWGSVSLYVAAKYPNCRVTSVSNSATQRAYIEGECQKRGLTNVTVITADINVFDIPRGTAGGGGGAGIPPGKGGGLLKALSSSMTKTKSKTGLTDSSSTTTEEGSSSSSSDPEELFDRAISIEMFEHCKNYQKLLGKVASWLKPGGKLFVHIFTHATTAYHFEGSWMANNFFTGGQMPSQDLLLYFQEDLRIEAQWVVNGRHYSKTNQAWLDNLDKHQAEAKALLGSIYGPDQATKVYVDWRLFFLTLVECFAVDSGNQWAVSLYRFVKP